MINLEVIISRFKMNKFILLTFLLFININCTNIDTYLKIPDNDDVLFHLIIHKDKVVKSETLNLMVKDCDVVEDVLSSGYEFCNGYFGDYICYIPKRSVTVTLDIFFFTFNKSCSLPISSNTNNTLNCIIDILLNDACNGFNYMHIGVIIAVPITIMLCILGFICY